MKKLFLLILVLMISMVCYAQTDIIIRNSSTQDSVEVYVTLQSTDNVVGMFGIKKYSSSTCKGSFWAKKNVDYHINRKGPIRGAIVTFNTDNQNCKSAISNGFPNGTNNFEFTINVEYETIDISCVDGVNSIIKYTVSDDYWTVGTDNYVKKFKSTQNKFPLDANCDVEGVFPYQCTDCIRIVGTPPSTCFGNVKKCTSKRICQVNRHSSSGGNVLVEYLGVAK